MESLSGDRPEFGEIIALTGTVACVHWSPLLLAGCVCIDLDDGGEHIVWFLDGSPPRGIKPGQRVRAVGRDIAILDDAG